MSFQEIELKVRFTSHEQLLKWKQGIMEALGKSQPPKASVQSSEQKTRPRTDTLVLHMPPDKSSTSQKPTSLSNSGPKNKIVGDEDLSIDLNEFDISIEKSSAQKPINFQRFSTKTKINVEKESFMREQRLKITRALTSSIVKHRAGDLHYASDSQVNLINNMNVTASRSREEINSIDAMFKLTERIK